MVDHSHSELDRQRSQETSCCLINPSVLGLGARLGSNWWSCRGCRIQDTGSAGKAFHGTECGGAERLCGEQSRGPHPQHAWWAGHGVAGRQEAHGPSTLPSFSPPLPRILHPPAPSVAALHPCLPRLDAMHCPWVLVPCLALPATLLCFKCLPVPALCFPRSSPCNANPFLPCAHLELLGGAHQRAEGTLTPTHVGLAPGKKGVCNPSGGR